MRGIRKLVSDVARSTRQVSLTVRTITGIKSTKPTMKEPEAYSKGRVKFTTNYQVGNS